MTRIGSLSDFRFILKREQTLKYTEKSIERAYDMKPLLIISAELVDKDVLEEEIEIVNDYLELVLPGYVSNFKLIALQSWGLNAGLILSHGPNIVQMALNNLRDGKLLSKKFFDKWEIIYTNG